jgi:integrase/recombinase XerD
MTNRITFSQAIQGYLLHANARRLSKHTLADYTTTFRKFHHFLDGDPPLASITPAQLRAFLACQDGISNKTLLNYHTGLSALWTWALAEGIVECHILRQVDRPRPEKRAVNPFTRADIDAMLGVCDRSRSYARPGQRNSNTYARPTAARDRAVVLVLLDTGIRASELGDLSVDHTDLKNRRILVQGKGTKQRIIPISPPTAQAIWRYLAQRPVPRRNTNRLFLTVDGGPLNRDSLRLLIKRLGRRAGVLHAHPHRFRHTFAIQFLRNGGNGYVLQSLLGHSTMDMVQTYLKLAQHDLDASHHLASPVDNWGF